MAEYVIQGSTLTGLADAVREKTGGTEALTPARMEEEILAMQYYGGSLGALPTLNETCPKDVIQGFSQGPVSATFNVVISEHGNPATYTYQWYMDSKAISGATNSSYTVSNITDTCSHTLYCTITNKMGTITTRTAKLQMTKQVVPTLNSSYPEDVSATVINNEVKSATFNVVISKAGIPDSYTYQWYVDGAAVSGATGSSYTKSDLNASASYNIYCNVTNAAGTVKSRTATLNVTKYTSPVLDANYPQDVTVVEGANVSASFSVSIATHGSPSTYSYQWYENGSAVSGATSSAYTKTGLSTEGRYTVYCTVTNTAGTVTSRTATLIVEDVIPTYSYTGEHSLINDSNGNWRIKFLSSGTFTPNRTMDVDVFLVGGGGGGGATWGSNRGGGGGGYTKTSRASVIKGTPYTITVGAGGAADVNGGNSSAFNILAGGGYCGLENNGGAGGSGGGGAPRDGWAGSGGYNGSNGGDSTGPSAPGKGGTGQGTNTYEFGAGSGTLYSGGGGAGGNASYGIGGAGGGGNGAQGGSVSTAGLTNTGGGGGGGINFSDGVYRAGSPGGSGIVIIRNAR